MKSKTLSKSEIKELNLKLNELYGIDLLNKKDNVLLIEDGNISYLKVNSIVQYFYYEKKPVPVLKALIKNNFLKKVTVDMGALKFLCSGADLMRPGIVDVEEGISSGDIVSVIDIKNKSPIILGISLFSSDEIRKQAAGKSVKNIHYAGDGIWKI